MLTLHFSQHAGLCTALHLPIALFGKSLLCPIFVSKKAPSRSQIGLWGCDLARHACGPSAHCVVDGTVAFAQACACWTSAAGSAAASFGPDGRVDMGGVPAAVNAALAAHFPPGCGVRVIAEPGRYFAEAAATLACLVYGVRDGRAADGAQPPLRTYLRAQINGCCCVQSITLDMQQLACRMHPWPLST